MAYFAAEITGFADMCAVRGPFDSIQAASTVMQSLPSRKSNLRLGDDDGKFFAVHQGTCHPDLCVVSGPHDSERDAAESAKRNWSENKADCGGDKGTVTRCVKVRQDGQVAILESV